MLHGGFRIIKGSVTEPSPKKLGGGGGVQAHNDFRPYSVCLFVRLSVSVRLFSVFRQKNQM